MTRNFHLNELSNDEFEDLIVHICLDILGQGTSKFAAGPDGGQDAKFTGTANNFPSQSDPAKGKFVIQAKHTVSPVASCSDSKFKTILKEEIPKIKKLVENNELDNYILFTNRKLTGGKEPELTQYLKEQTGLQQIWLRGKEDIEAYLTSNPKLVINLNLNRLRQPLQIHPEELVKIISIFHEHLENLQPTSKTFDLIYLNLERKNEINQLTKAYFEYIKENSEIYFEEIKIFLEAPRNKKEKLYYQNIVDELKGKLIIHRDKFDAFEESFAYLYDEILVNHPEIENRQLINIFLHYMYCNCDIGKKV